jgi:PAS domain S-box-containing protein
MSLTAAFRWNLSDGSLSASSEVGQLFGVSSQAATKMEMLRQRVHPSDAMLLQKTLDQAAVERISLDFACRFILPDQSVKHIQFTARPIKEAKNVYYSGIMVDVSSAKSTELTLTDTLKKVQSQNTQFKLTVENIPGMVWSALPNGYCDYLNPKWLQYTGLTHEEACGWGWLSALHPDDAPSMSKIWAEVLALGTPGEAKARLRGHDGNYRWFMFRSVPYYDDSGHLVKWYGQTIDIEDIKQAESLLAGEKRVLENIAKGSSLEEILDTLCRTVDEMLPGVISSVWLTSSDGARLSNSAAPGLPITFIQDIDKGILDLNDGPCGVAINTRSTVIVPDIRENSRWEAYCRVVQPYGLVSCFSTPIFSLEGKAIGTFSLQFKEASLPTDYQRRIVDHFAHLICVAIERRYMDMALKESEQRFRLMAETTPDVIWLFGLDPAKMLYVSPSFEKVWGYKASEIYEDYSLWLKIVHPDDIEKVQKFFRQEIIKREKNHYNIEFRIVRRDGSTRWIHQRAVYLFDENDRPYQISAIATDVTDQKLIEASFRQSEERFALAVAASADGIWDWDIQSDRMFISERAQRIYGLNPGETVRSSSEWFDMINMHSADAEVHGSILEDYLLGITPSYDVECRVYQADGIHRWIRIRGLCVRNNQGVATRIAGSISDIDLQKRTGAALQQARRLQAMGTLAGGIAHDFNNILGVILGYGEMALRGTIKGSRRRRDIDNIINAGKRGRSLVDRILTFSRSGMSERLAVQVQEIVEEVVNLVTATLPGNIQIQADLTAGKSSMIGDATQIHQVVMNLITNAKQAMPSGGVIKVSLRTQYLETTRITTTGIVDAGSCLVLQVKDNGSGIEPEILDRIFDPFFTTKEVGDGTGLGLSLVHGIVTDVGGAIDVASKPGEGSAFTVYFPCIGETVVQNSPVLPAAVKGTGQRILIVDDEEQLAVLAADTLSDLGYLTTTFTSSTAALSAFQASPMQFDAVLTDERMPGMPGSLLIMELRRLRPEIRVALMTGYLGEAAVKQKLEYLADVVLQKPLTMQEMETGMSRLFS